MRRNRVLNNIVLVLLLLSFSLNVYFIARDVVTNKSNSVSNEDYVEEIMQIRTFVSDWYKEAGIYSYSMDVNLNKITVKNNDYSLTYSNNRIRAVCDGTELFYDCKYITTVEFFELSNTIRCRVFYDDNEQYSFKIN